MATFATLPGDLLTAIASYVDTPHFVVAVAADGDARAAVRRWTSKSPPRGPFSQASARIWIEGGARVLFWDCQGLLIIAALCASKVGLLGFVVWDVRLLLSYSFAVGFFSQYQLSKQDGRFNGNRPGYGRQAGRVILRRALGLMICTPLGALCRCAAYEQLLDVLHIVQATGIKQALFPK